MTDIDELMDGEYARVLAIDAARDAEAGLRDGGIVAVILDLARNDALAAMETLISAKHETLDDVRELQWQVSRYDSLRHWIRQILEAGEIAREDLSEDEVDHLNQMLSRGETEPKDA